MLQCLHALEAAGKSFGAKKLRDLSELGELCITLSAATPTLQHIVSLMQMQCTNSMLTQQKPGEQLSITL